MVAQKRVAIYARVSTVDKGQDPETQLLGLREYARMVKILMRPRARSISGALLAAHGTESGRHAHLVG
jgi:predicted site-specific integrase-resolvase